MAKTLFTIFSLMTCLFQFIVVDADDAEVTLVSSSCVKGNRYTYGSVYQQNLNLLLSNLSSKASAQNFYNATSGDVPDKVYALYQCRADVSPEICNQCIVDAAKTIVQSCPSVREAIVWYYECMLRYANRPIFSSTETLPGFQRWGLRNVSNYGDFAPVLASKLNRVINQAAVGTPLRHFATADGNWTLFDNVYCLAQCTPDIDELHCRNCLRSALSDMINDFNTSIRVMIYKPSCQLRYDTTQQFYHVLDATAPAPAPSETHITTPGKSKASRSFVLNLSLGISMLIMIALVTLY